MLGVRSHPPTGPKGPHFELRSAVGYTKVSNLTVIFKQNQRMESSSVFTRKILNQLHSSRPSHSEHFIERTDVQAHLNE